MNIAERGNARWRLYALAAFVVALVAAGLAPATATASENATVDVIVREKAPDTDEAEDLVGALSGTVGDHLAIIGGFVATVPADALATLAADPAVTEVTPNSDLTLLGAGWEDATKLKFNPSTYAGTVNRVADSVLQAPAFWSDGYTGESVDVALIDSGVVPVDGLTYPGKVINGPDLSFESQSNIFRHLDTSGHGTHMAGIIAGRDNGAAISGTSNDFLGVAPGARIVSVKVAGHDGATDVSQVIAAIDWVVQHRNDNGMNIRVLNLSFGTDSTQSYVLDPLAFAVEQAWKAGIVVVVAAGNDGNASALRNPATNPFVIAVGAANHGTTRSKVNDVLEFTNCGTANRHVDVVVPGESITGLRAPGTRADDENPQSVVAGRYMLGSGTSQATAFVAGAAALIVDAAPEATPDQVKELLMTNSADGRFRGEGERCLGAGLPNLEWALHEITHDGLPTAVQTHTPSTGLGSLEAARGSDHIEDGGVVLEGEQDIFGNAWDGAAWSAAAAAGASWSGGQWNGVDWSGLSWSGLSWSGLSWSGLSWSGLSWSGLSWSSKFWSGLSWSGLSWSGLSWSGLSWSGEAWLGLSWK